MLIATAGSKAIEKRYGTTFIPGRISKILCKFLPKQLTVKSLCWSRHCFFTDPVTGDSGEWVYTNTNAKLSYVFELRDRGRFRKIVGSFYCDAWKIMKLYNRYRFAGRYGHNLPADQIIPSSKEIIDGLVAMVAEGRKLEYLWKECFGLFLITKSIPTPKKNCLSSLLIDCLFQIRATHVGACHRKICRKDQSI